MLGARMRRIFSADLMQSVPNQLNRPTLRREIPNIAGDYTMGPTNAAHFSKRLRPIRYKVNYKSRNYDVEGVVRERQLLRVRNPKIHSLRDWFLARNFDLWLRRIDRDYCRGRARTDYKIGKDSSATTDIEPARIVGGASQSRKIVPMARVQRPMNCSYAVPSLKRCVLRPFRSSIAAIKQATISIVSPR